MRQVFAGRGSLALWMTPEALIGWQALRRKTRGAQPRYADLAIETALTLSLVFGLRLRQTEGLLGSVLQLMGLNLPVPDHTTLSRRTRTWKPSAGLDDGAAVASVANFIFTCQADETSSRHHVKNQ
jgi:hypothetical protein